MVIVMRSVIVVLCLFAKTILAQVQPLEDAPSTLKLASGADVQVLEMFKSTFIETDEAVVVLSYPTSKTKDDLCTEVEEVWACFKPIVEKQNVKAAVIFQKSGSGGGFTWIWKRDENGVWDRPCDEVIATNVNGLNGRDIIVEAQRADAIVHVRLFFKPGVVKDPKHPNVEWRIIERAMVVETLKQTPGFVGEQAIYEARRAWHPGQRWLASGKMSVDYLVLNTLPVDNGNHMRGGFSMVPITDGVLRNVNRAIGRDEKIQPRKKSPRRPGQGPFA